MEKEPAQNHQRQEKLLHAPAFLSFPQKKQHGPVDQTLKKIHVFFQYRIKLSVINALHNPGKFPAVKLIDPESLAGGLVPLGHCLFIIKIQSISRVIFKFFQRIRDRSLCDGIAFFRVAAGLQKGVVIKFVIPAFRPFAFLHSHGNPERLRHTASNLHAGTVFVKRGQSPVQSCKGQNQDHSGQDSLPAFLLQSLIQQKNHHGHKKNTVIIFYQN